jgi:SAM-dependent methyltransferase
MTSSTNRPPAPLKDHSHYYDGAFYAWVLDPILKEVRNQILSQIPKDTYVVDMACGTGALAFELAKMGNRVIGVELSKAMHHYSQQKLSKIPLSNLEFCYGDATNLPEFKTHQFDYAIFSMTLHEMPPTIRLQALQEAKRISKSIIIADYINPMPLNLSGLLVRIAEFFAGQQHYKGYKDYQRTGGLAALLQKLDLIVETRKKSPKHNIEVVVCQPH